MKRVVVLFLVIAMLLGVLAACDKGETASSGAGAQESLNVDASQNVGSQAGQKEGVKYNFAIVYGGVHPFFDPWRFGAQQAALDLGIPTPNVTSPQNWDQTQQNAIIDGLVAGGVNGIGMFTSDAVAGNEKISELVDMGIPVVTMGGSPATPSKATLCYTTDVGASVGYATQAIIDKLKADGKTEGKIMHLCSSLADTNTQKRQAAIKDVLAKPENAGFVLAWELADTDATQPAEEAISAMYSSYYKEVDGIVCTGYINAQVLAKTMNERKTNDGIVAIGIDDSSDVMKAIENGYMYGTMTQSSWAMGYVGTYALKLLADGYTYKEDAPFLIDSACWLNQCGLLE
jgi:ribose transport system substrate-binding protein